MLTIYSIPVSLYCAKLRILLRNKDLRWRELPPPGGYGSEEYKQIVPSGNLPAMDEGRLVLGDSEAIAEYLEEKYPDPPMLPTRLEDRAIVRELSRFHDTRLEPEVRKLFSQIEPAARNVDQIATQSAAINQRFSQLSRLLETRAAVISHQLMLCDCGFPITFAWIDLLQPELKLAIEWPQSVVTYREQIARIPAVQVELTSYVPTLKQWLADRTKA